MQSIFLTLLNFILITQINAKTLNRNFDNNPLSFEEIHKEFSKNNFKKKLQDNQPLVHLKKMKHYNNLDLSQTHVSRNEILNEFLATKIYQHLDIINQMTVPEFRHQFEDTIKISKYNAEEHANTTDQKRIGSTSCILEKLTNSHSRISVPVCSWHWVMTEREDKYPFQRPNAICNCKECQANTIYDSDRRRLSGCIPNLTLVPMLFRESFKPDATTERWWFRLEEVPTSCVCSLILKPIKY